MSEPQGTSGPQFRADRPEEQAAVSTTIVGGRPPGSGQPVGQIPRGIEVLVKKASIDPQFKTILLSERAKAAERIGLDLDPAETLMLGAVPGEQLETIIAQTTVPQQHRRAFLGQAAAAMLAAVGFMTAGCPAVQGIRPEPKGIRPDPVSKGDQPDRAPVTDGIRPDPVEQPEHTRVSQETPPPEDAPPESDASPTADQAVDEPASLPPPPPPAPTGIRPDRIPVPEGIRPDRIPVTKGTRPKD